MADPKGPPPQPPMLTRVSVSFHTNDEDKDHDTLIEIVVFLADGQTEVAKISQCFGHFDDHSDSGPYNLVLLQSVSRAALTTGSVYLVTGAAGGRFTFGDTWRFNVLVDLVFSDGGHLLAKSNGIELGPWSRQIFVGIE